MVYLRVWSVYVRGNAIPTHTLSLYIIRDTQYYTYVYCTETLIYAASLCMYQAYTAQARNA